METSSGIRDVARAFACPTTSGACSVARSPSCTRYGNLFSGGKLCLVLRPVLGGAPLSGAARVRLGSYPSFPHWARLGFGRSWPPPTPRGSGGVCLLAGRAGLATIAISTPGEVSRGMEYFAGGRLSVAPFCKRRKMLVRRHHAEGRCFGFPTGLQLAVAGVLRRATGVEIRGVRTYFSCARPPNIAITKVTPARVMRSATSAKSKTRARGGDNSDTGRP